MEWWHDFVFQLWSFSNLFVENAEIWLIRQKRIDWTLKIKRYFYDKVKPVDQGTYEEIQDKVSR